MPSEKTNQENIHAIVLAAGESSRLGRPKQLLEYNGRTFLQNSVQIAIASGVQKVVVVLGAHAEKIKKEIAGGDVHLVENTEWKEGMASSIRSGLQAISEIDPGVESVILMVCDQPFVTASLLNELITVHQKTGKPIVACSYENTFGPPVLFHKTIFQELLQLRGDVGARGIVSKHTGEVELIPFPKGTYDIDTDTDYARIMGNSQ
jgi:molybdenum cofactor cytidylyltransferase